MNIITKLKDFKNRLRDRHMFTIVIVSLLSTITMGLYILKIRNDNRQALENTYNYAFYELSSYIDNINNLLTKAQISRDPIHGAKTMSEIWRESNLAQNNLSKLPIEQSVISNASKFLTQTSDFSYTLTMQTINKMPISTSQLEKIKSLSDYADKLHQNIVSLNEEINAGRLHWNEIAKKGTETFKQVSSETNENSFTKIAKEFQDYPGLIYDGPFSEHITNIKPVGITGSEIDEVKAKSIVKEFIGSDRIKNIESVNETTKSNIPAFDISLTLKNDTTLYLAVSKVGGHPIYMMNNRAIKTNKLSTDEAINVASNFLKTHGYKNMKSTYYMEESGVSTINFAYTEKDVTIYPDLIKVQIAMDNGEIVGFEAAGFLFSHKERDIPAPKITIDMAKSMLNEKLNLVNSGLAIIPTDVKTEVLVYEFKGKVDEREFIVYINAETGAEEDILIILHTPNGILTI